MTLSNGLRVITCPSAGATSQWQIFATQINSIWNPYALTVCSLALAVVEVARFVNYIYGLMLPIPVYICYCPRVNATIYQTPRGVLVLQVGQPIAKHTTSQSGC